MDYIEIIMYYYVLWDVCGEHDNQVPALVAM